MWLHAKMNLLCISPYCSCCQLSHANLAKRRTRTRAALQRMRAYALCALWGDLVMGPGGNTFRIEPLDARSELYLLAYQHVDNSLPLPYHSRGRADCLFGARRFCGQQTPGTL